MMKKLSILALVSACSMIAAPKVKAPQLKSQDSDSSSVKTSKDRALQAEQAREEAIQKYAKKVRTVTLTDDQVATVQKAHKKAQGAGVESPLLAKHAARIAAGDREVSRDERIALFNEICDHVGRETGHLA